LSCSELLKNIYIRAAEPGSGLLGRLTELPARL
jgi:hypothetical protein